MKIRILAVSLLILLLSVSASAQMDARHLPPCFAYAVHGMNSVYSDEPVCVYQQKYGGEVIGRLLPGQVVTIQEIDRENGWVYVTYEQGSAAERGGWMELYYFTFYGFDGENAYVVMTDQPGERLNLRKSPDSSSISFGKYYAGTVVLKLDEPENGFMKVRSGHMEGYMDVRYLKKGMYCEHEELPVLTVVNPSGTGVNLRKLPGKNSEIIKTAPNGERVTVVSVRDDGWYQVVYENEIGYARADLLSPKLSYHR